jgi:hypothetical protein
MHSGNSTSSRSVATGLHPLIYRIVVGLCVWFVASVWGFTGPGYTGLALTVVSLFVAAAILLPVVLSRISRRDDGRRSESVVPSRITEWLSGDFDAWSGRLSGVDAAVQVLLPIAAVALGMSSFALVLHLTVG